MFITVATHQRYTWFRLHPDLCLQCVEIFTNLARARNSLLYAWCVLPEHIHLLVDDQDIVELIRLPKGRLTPFARRIDPQRKLWQRSFYDHVLRQTETVNRVALYIWENPVRAGLVDEPQEYEWSGSNVWPDFKNWYGLGRG